jgi:hypothetical protein
MIKEKPMTLPNLTAQQSLGPALGTYATIISPAVSSKEIVETMMEEQPKKQKTEKEEEDKISLHTYIIKDLANDVVKQIELYEEFTFVDAFAKVTEIPRLGVNWFYERTIEGFIYNLLFNRFGISLFNKEAKYLFFLEQPYEATNIDNQTDIMLVDTTEETITAIEIKNDFKFESIFQDFKKLNEQLSKGNAAIGYAIFFVESQETLEEWNAEINKEFRHKKLFLVPIIYNPA